MTVTIPRDGLNAVMAQFNDHWHADAVCDPESVRAYAAYIRGAASDPRWPNLTDADRKANLAQADAMDAFIDRIGATS